MESRLNEQVDESVLQVRVDELLAEAQEHDERIAALSDLVEAAEYKDQSQAEERLALEAWVGEIEQRIAQREFEWQAELDALQQQLEQTKAQRDATQKEMREIASRYDAPKAYQETLERLQSENAKLQEECESSRTQCVELQRQIDSVGGQEAIDLCEERTLLAKERAEISRLRFELSQKLSDVTEMPEPQHNDDREFAMRLRTLRTELRAINEQQRLEREEKGESLISRISGLWKRVDEY